MLTVGEKPHQPGPVSARTRVPPVFVHRELLPTRLRDALGDLLALLAEAQPALGLVIG